MCAIAGIVCLNQTTVKPKQLDELLKPLKHRGRDSQGYFVSDNKQLALGHHRLSIIDLSNNATQPMTSDDQRFTLCFNGEIYNFIELRAQLQKSGFSFNSSSDTEVLLKAYQHWGEACLEKLNGIFAFAIWDNQQQVLFCARDQLGVKPFYYLKMDDYFYFASESKALAKLIDYQLNGQALASYLLCMYVPCNMSIFNKINKLLPAHALKVSLSNNIIQSFRYWHLKKIGRERQSANTTQELEQKLKTAIERQIRSDVPIGGFLSGGLDSGIITALAAKKVDQYHTYSIGFEGMNNSELSTAKKIANKYHTIHHEFLLKSSHVVDYLQQAIRCFSEPIADSAMVPAFILSQMAKQDGVKVLLNGTGGDEIFGGYDRYVASSLKRKLLLNTPKPLLKLLIPVLPKLLQYRVLSPTIDMLLSCGGLPQLVQHLMGKKALYSSLNYINSLQPLANRKFSIAHQRMLADLNLYLPDELLFLLDQTTMHHTLEGRVPLLDIDLVKFAYCFHSSTHIDQNNKKKLLKKVARHYLGDQVDAKKQGFGGPVSYWVKQNQAHFINTISNSRFANRHQLPINAFINSKNFTLNHQACHFIFRLYCLTVWYDEVIQWKQM